MYVANFSHPWNNMVENYYRVVPPTRPDAAFLEERFQLFGMRKGFGLVEGWNSSDIEALTKQLLTYAR